MAKFLCCGDLHLDEKKPKNRTESFVKDQEEKVRWILQLAKDEGCQAILQPGDFCNTSKLSDRFKTHWINVFRHFDVPIYTVPGQHDMRYHSSDIGNTPMGVLAAAKSINIVNISVRISKELTLYGAGWEQDIPKIQALGFPEIGTHILLLHKMVSEGALWPGHEGYITPKWLFNHTDFDLIVCGDNHKGFTTTFNTKHEGITINRRHVINCGSLMRSSIDQQDHLPRVYIYNTDGVTLHEHLIPIKPFEEVMHIAEAEKEKARNEEMENFVEGLSDTNIEGLDFKKNLIDHLKANKGKISDGVIKLINEVVG